MFNKKLANFLVPDAQSLTDRVEAHQARIKNDPSIAARNERVRVQNNKANRPLLIAALAVNVALCACATWLLQGIVGSMQDALYWTLPAFVLFAFMLVGLHVEAPSR